MKPFTASSSIACRSIVWCAILGVALLIVQVALTAEPDSNGWYSLFNGTDLTGWKASENADTFKVVDGEIVIHGPRSHLFYVGPVCNADFKNFQWKCEVLMKPHSNSGMYFHTAYQDEGWVTKGYEAQLDNTHSDPRRTGGLYAVADVLDQSPVEDDRWFTQEVTVVGKHITVRVNGRVITDYTEPENVKRPPESAGKRLSHGTIALQGHDPDSEVHVRRILIKPLPSSKEQQ
jgi:3-keto-disaccharide hydrolase